MLRPVTGVLHAETLLARPVLARGVRLGQPTDVVVDLHSMRVVGLEVRCGDDVDRFLPLPAAQILDDGIELDSALQLLDERDLAFYRRRASSFRALRGLGVDLSGRELGTLADLVVGGDGAITELVVVDAAGERRRVPLQAALGIGGRRIASAA